MKKYHIVLLRDPTNTIRINLSHSSSSSTKKIACITAARLKSIRIKYNSQNYQRKILHYVHISNTKNILSSLTDPMNSNLLTDPMNSKYLLSWLSDFIALLLYQSSDQRCLCGCRDQRKILAASVSLFLALLKKCKVEQQLCPPLGYQRILGWYTALALIASEKKQEVPGSQCQYLCPESFGLVLWMAPRG